MNIIFMNPLMNPLVQDTPSSALVSSCLNSFKNNYWHVQVQQDLQPCCQRQSDLVCRQATICLLPPLIILQLSIILYPYVFHPINSNMIFINLQKFKAISFHNFQLKFSKRLKLLAYKFCVLTYFVYSFQFQLKVLLSVYRSCIQ